MHALPTKRDAASLGRIYQHVKGAGFGIITSWRQDAPIKTNIAVFKQLKSLVRGAGYGFVELNGYWEDESATEAGHEPSLFIPAVQSRAAYALPQVVVDAFESWMLKIARKFNQDAFVLGDGERVYLINQQGKRLDLGTFNADRISQAWSKIKKGPHRGRSFIFAKAQTPKTQVDAIKRQAEGEIWSYRALTEYVKHGINHTHYPPKSPQMIQRLALQEIAGKKSAAIPVYTLAAHRLLEHLIVPKFNLQAIGPGSDSSLLLYGERLADIKRAGAFLRSIKVVEKPTRVIGPDPLNGGLDVYVVEYPLNRKI